MRAPVLPSRRLQAILLLPLAAILILLGSSCYTLHTENSWIRIQNMGSAAANIEIRYLGAQGNVVASESCPGVCPAIPPGGGWTFIEGRSASLPKGFVGSAVVTSDQPIAVLLASDVDAGDGYYQTAGDTVALNAGSGKLYLPLVMNKDGPAQDWDSRFAIQNMGGTTACATLVYTSNYGDSAVHWDPFNPQVAGFTPQDGCPQGGIPIAAGATLFRSYQTMGVDSNFTGSVRVDLYPNAQGVSPSQQFVVATANTFNADSHQFAGYSGFTSNDMGTSLLLPLIERTAGGEWSTDFEIMNSDSSQPATVTLKIDGLDGNNQPISKSSSFVVQASRQCFQDVDVANCLAAGDTLPQNFHDGTARITSSRPVGVVVSRSNRGEVYTSYRGLRTDTAGKRLYLPLVDKNSPDGASRAGLTSWVQVATADGGAANLTIRYVSGDLPGGQTSYKMKVNGTAKLLQAWETSLPASFTGSMVIDSDMPIVAVADVIAGAYPGDTDLMYEGVTGP